MLNRSQLGMVLLALVAAVGAGCAASEKRAAGERGVLSAAEYDAAYNASIAVLRDHGYKLGRRDYRHGVVTSEPRGAGSVFEAWDANHTGLKPAVGTTLNDERRTVTVSLSPVAAAAPQPNAEDAEGEAPPQAYTLAVVVLIERKQDTTRRLGGATRGQVFTTLGETPSELKSRGIDGPYWQPVGRDARLEQKLAAKITQRMATLR